VLIFDRLGGDPADAIGEVALAFEWRQKSRMRLAIESGPRAGEAIGFDLPRGTVLRGGSLVSTAAGECLRVNAADEELIHVEAPTPFALMRIAYHLGNRHVPLQIGEGWIRLQYDHVLENMVKGLGGAVTLVDASFDPESGAYGYGHHGHAHHDHAHHDHAHHDHAHRADHDDRRHAPLIHDFLTDPLQPK
jgi:urease accessory protein